FEDDGVLHHEQVAFLVADRTFRSVRAPDVLERVPLEAALPADVDDRGRVAEARGAFVPVLGQDLRAPFPAYVLRPLAQRVRDFDGKRDRLERWAVDRPDVGAFRVLDQP